MLFNSLDFLLFLPLVFLLYWFVFNRNLKVQNLLVLVASYVFYGWWDWRFLGLIILSSIVDFVAGLMIQSSTEQRRRKAWLILSIVTNLGILGIFKYFDFFIGSFVNAIELVGLHLNYSTLNLVFPVGISFYTFQTMSYSIDVYRGRFVPTKDPLAFFAFVSFFPQLVAGPIERARNLLPQFFKKRVFDFDLARDGMRQILWGFFTKVVLADNCAVFVDAIFAENDELGGLMLLLGSFLFTCQIYWDFAGYSNIAIGTAKLFGFKLMRNFGYAQYVRNVAEFWRIWHISLTTWIRDYLAIVLPRKKTIWSQLKNTMIIFFAIGLWHGANWTFICWGLMNGVWFCWFILSKKERYSGVPAEHSNLPTLKEVWQMLSTYVILSLVTIIFRSPDVQSAVSYYANLFVKPFDNPITQFYQLDFKWQYFLELNVFIWLAHILEWVQRRKHHALQDIEWHVILRWLVYIVLTAAVLNYLVRERPYIYFQF